MTRHKCPCGEPATHADFCQKHWELYARQVPAWDAIAPFWAAQEFWQLLILPWLINLAFALLLAAATLGWLLGEPIEH